MLTSKRFLTADKVMNIIYKLYTKKITGIFNIGSGKGLTVKNL